MYRLTLYILIALVAIASLFSFFGQVQYSAFDLVSSTAIVVISCYIANIFFSKIFKAVTNVESVLITALIIVLIFPLKFPHEMVALIAVSILSMGSKYFLTVEKRHLFNPAAVAVLMVSLLSAEHSANWWIGTPIMIIPVAVGGFLIIRKIQRERMILVFILSFLFFTMIAAILHQSSILVLWQKAFLSSAVLFFSTIMLTEPATSPTTKTLQSWYAVVVAFLYTSPLLRLGGIIFTPEMALIAGNIFSHILNPNYRLILPLLRKVQLSPDTFVFQFPKTRNFKFIPGQYMEWTLPHKNSDSRGNRRYFSIASAPHEDIMMAIKFYSPSSSYKKALLEQKEQQEIIATSLSGDFVMPKKRKTPLVFIAGGVGIAPFRSILEDIIHKKEMVDIIVLFANKRREDIIFSDTLERARSFGVKTYYVLSDKNAAPQNWNGLTGHVTQDTIKGVIPDLLNRKFYISGPQLMVQNFENVLLHAGVRKSAIKTDFFPGYQESST